MRKRFLDSLTDGFGAAVADIRQRVVEEGFWGKIVTPRRQTITIGSPGEQSPGEQLGWWRHDEPAHPSSISNHDRDPAKDHHVPDRGIDL